MRLSQAGLTSDTVWISGTNVYIVPMADFLRKSPCLQLTQDRPETIWRKIRDEQKGGEAEAGALVAGFERKFLSL